MSTMSEEELYRRYERVYAKIDLNRIVSNLIQLKAKISEQTQIMCVIKTDGYGHGAVPIAREAENLDFVYGFAVATYEEGHILRQAGIKKPILVLGYCFPHTYKRLIEEDIRPTIFTESCAMQLNEVAKSMKKICKIHLKVDVGMGRIGVTPDQTGCEFVKKLRDCKALEVEGIFTHFPRADEADKTITGVQFGKFQSFVKQSEEVLGRPIAYKHCANSASILELGYTNCDLVRAGIVMYGIDPSPEVEVDEEKIKPVLSLHSSVVFCKWIEKGECISYGGTYQAGGRTRIATIPVGYGDGYPRSLSNRGYVLIHGKRAPIVGRVCMDQMMVDVTSIPETETGDDVVLIGESGNEKITASFLGELSGRFSYELLCDLGKRIPRIYIKDGKTVGSKDYFEDYE